MGFFGWIKKTVASRKFAALALAARPVAALAQGRANECVGAAAR